MAFFVCNTDNLYLDLNHAIYESVRAVLEKRQEAIAQAAAAVPSTPSAEGATPAPVETPSAEQLEKTLDEEVCTAVCELIDSLVGVLRPRLLLYIGIDGSWGSCALSPSPLNASFLPRSRSTCETQ